MQTKTIIKIWLLSVNFEKLTSISLWGGKITALQTLDCDWSVHKFIEVNISELTDSNQILRNYFVCIHYHICEISSQITECKISASYDIIEINSLAITTLQHTVCKSARPPSYTGAPNFNNAPTSNTVHGLHQQFCNAIWATSAFTTGLTAVTKGFTAITNGLIAVTSGLTAVTNGLTVVTKGLTAVTKASQLSLRALQLSLRASQLPLRPHSCH